MSRYLLDTDILIDVQRGYSPAVAWLSSLPEPPSVPVPVVMELIQDAQNTRQVRQALKLIAPLPITWLTEADCVRALSALRPTICRTDWVCWIRSSPPVRWNGRQLFAPST